MLPLLDPPEERPVEVTGREFGVLRLRNPSYPAESPGSLPLSSEPPQAAMDTASRQATEIAAEYFESPFVMASFCLKAFGPFDRRVGRVGEVG